MRLVFNLCTNFVLADETRKIDSSASSYIAARNSFFGIEQKVSSINDPVHRLNFLIIIALKFYYYNDKKLESNL